MSKFWSGNVTRDPELTFADSGSAIVKFGIAENWKTNPKNGGEAKEITSFYNVVAFGKQAENIANSLRKGDSVGIEGRLEINRYEKKDGSEGTSADIIANFVGPSLRFAVAVPQKNEREFSPSQQQFLGEEEPF